MRILLPLTLTLVGFVILGGCNESKQAGQEQDKKPQQEQARQHDKKKELIIPTEPPPGLQIGFQIGMIAPEIEAEDIDGQVFKLSEYRGKVVVLDFWGDW